METIETLTARKFNVYLCSGSAEVPAIQIGSYLTAATAYNAVLDWTPRIAGRARVCVYVNEAGSTRGGEYVAAYGASGMEPVRASGAERLGWGL